VLFGPETSRGPESPCATCVPAPRALASCQAKPGNEHRMRAARLFKRLLGFDAVSVIAVDVVAEKVEQIVVVNLARPCV